MKTQHNGFVLQIANEQQHSYAQELADMYQESARIRGTGIARRNPEYLKEKMNEGKAVIALTEDGILAGFCYIETFGNGSYVSNSGLIVKNEFRKFGLAKAIKKLVLELSASKFPGAKVFGITTNGSVMKINSELGYKPVPFAELTDDEEFWQGCSSCPNYDILTRTGRKMCLCTGMLFTPPVPKEPATAASANGQTEQKADTDADSSAVAQLVSVLAV